MKIFFILMVTIYSSMTFAQSMNIEGRITYKDAPVEGAFVVIENMGETYIGQSNEKGYFKIAIPSSDNFFRFTLHHLMYETTTLEMSNGSGTFFELEFGEEKIQVLDEIILEDRNIVKHYADKTVYNAENNAALQIGSIIETLGKLPGVIILSEGQIIHNGKAVNIFLDGEPSGYTEDQLSSFLQTLPSGAVRSIEIIENPGARFSSQINGTIINIVTGKSKLKGISGNIVQQNRFNGNFKNSTSATVFYNQKNFTWSFIPSYTLDNADTKTFNFYKWQEEEKNEFTKIEELFENSKNRNTVLIQNDLKYQINPASNIYFSHRYNTNLNNSSSIGLIERFISDEQTIFNQELQNERKSSGHIFNLRYTQEFDSTGTYLSVLTKGQFSQNSFENILSIDDLALSTIFSNEELRNMSLKIDFEKPVGNTGITTSFGGAYEASEISHTGAYKGEIQREYVPYNFYHTNSSMYGSISKNFRKLMINVGLRGELLNYETRSKLDPLKIGREIASLFPSASLKYIVLPGVIVNAGYTKNLALPDFTQFNLNITSIDGAYVTDEGNPFLSPQINHNTQIGLTIFDFIQFRYHLDFMNNRNMRLFERKDESVILRYNSVEEGTYSRFYMGIPFPLEILTSGLSEILSKRNNLSIDKMSFMYINLGLSKYNFQDSVPTNFQKRSVHLSTFTQIYLKNELRLFVNYYRFFNGGWGNYYLDKPSENLNIYLNKRFANNKASIDLGVYNVLNNAGYSIYSYGRNLVTGTESQYERRMFKIGFSYSFGSVKKMTTPNLNTETPDGLISL